MKLKNSTSVTALIEKIQVELKTQTGSWRKVAELLNQAELEFGFGTDEMKRILKQTNISISKASKLIRIAQDRRINGNTTLFDSVSAWTTLYQATLLNDDEFEELVRSANEERVLTLQDVKSVKNNKTHVVKSTYKNLVSVQFDWNAIKAQAVSTDDIQNVVAALNEIVSHNSYMRVDVSSKIEEETNKYNQEVINEFNRQSKKLYRKKEKAYKKHYQIKRGQLVAGLDVESIRVYISDNDFTALFDNLGILSEYEAEHNKLFNMASEIVEKKRQKRYGDKIAVSEASESTIDQDSDFQEIKRMIDRRKRKKLGNVNIRL